MVLLWAETSRRVPLAPSLLLQYWLAVSTQPGSYQLQVHACMHACTAQLLCMFAQQAQTPGVQIRSQEGQYGWAQHRWRSDLLSCMRR